MFVALLKSTCAKLMGANLLRPELVNYSFWSSLPGKFRSRRNYANKQSKVLLLFINCLCEFLFKNLLCSFIKITGSKGRSSCSSSSSRSSSTPCEREEDDWQEADQSFFFFSKASWQKDDCSSSF